MRVFVTGGTGFLGKRVVRELLRRGDDVCCLVRPGGDVESFRSAVLQGGGGGRLDFARATLTRIESCADEIAKCDVVVHAAAAMTGGTAVLFLNNVTATRQLLALADGTNVRRFVLVSSMGVYGVHSLRPGQVLDENCPLDPSPHLRDPYSYSKIEQERVAWERCAAAKLPLVVIRPGVMFGPGRGALSARVGLQIGNVMLRMGGRQRLPYTYVDNCADAIVRATAAPDVEGEAFNIVDDELPTGRRLLREYRRKVKRLRVVPVPRWGISPLSRLCEWYHERSHGQLPLVLTRYKSAAQWKPLRYSNSKAKTGLGWRPQVAASEGLRQSWEWARAQLAGV